MSKQWFYAKRGGERQGPVDESVLKGLVASGTIAGADLVWSDGMAEWQPAGSVFTDVTAPTGPGLRLAATPQPTPSPFAAAALAATGAGVPDGLRGWTKFSGVMNMISGILACLTCFGLVNGIFQIVMGASLLGGARALENARTNDPELSIYLAKMKTFMVVQGILWILTLVGVIVGIVMAVLYIGMLTALFSQLQQSMPAPSP